MSVGSFSHNLTCSQTSFCNQWSRPLLVNRNNAGFRHLRIGLTFGGYIYFIYSLRYHINISFDHYMWLLQLKHNQLLPVTVLILKLRPAVCLLFYQVSV